MKKLQNNRQSGITLIALVITIIVLIILAGVAINLTLGQNGLLNRTKEAREKYEIASAKEYIELKIDECIIEKGGDASLQDIIDYLAEDSSVTYYVALEEVGLVAGEVDIGSPKEIYVVYNSYQFKVDESKKVEFISIVDVDLEGKVSIEAQVKEYLGKNAEEKYEASVLLKATGDAEISKLEIQNPDGTTLTLEPDGLTTVGKDMTIEFDKTYKVILTTANGHRYTKKIIEKSEETIMNAEQLASFRDKVNSGLTYEGKTVKLGVDIDLSTVCGANVGGKEVSWEPIGYYNSETENCSFKGTFDGNNKTISNLYINTAANYQGVFGYTINLSIKNLSVTGVIKNANQYVAAIAGMAYDATIENCYSYVNMHADKNERAFMAGIVGYAKNTNIVKCKNYGNISVNSAYVGGIVSCIRESNVEECINYGNINGTGNSFAFGGIVGVIQTATIDKCVNTGKVVSTGNGIGGIVGAIWESGGENNYVYNSYNTGNISGNYVAAICGDCEKKIYLENCYNTGKIEGSYRKALVSNAKSSTIEIKNSYYLNSCNAGGKGTSKTTTELQGLSSSLGDAFTSDVKVKVIDESTGEEKEVWKYNNGYPILKWQLQENQVTE